MDSQLVRNLQLFFGQSRFPLMDDLCLHVDPRSRWASGIACNYDQLMTNLKRTGCLHQSEFLRVKIDPDCGLGVD